MSYRMIEVGPTCSFKKIMHGRKWVGRVCKHADGGFLGVIGKLTAHRPTEREAFEEVCALQMGFGSAAELHALQPALSSGW